MAMSDLPVDAAQRATALDTRQSFCVTAPAGSGKTELLTQRLLKLLAQVEQPEAILAITFTRKAAAEMRQRVLDALRLGAQADPPAVAYQQQTWQLAQAALQQDQAQGWQLLQNPARLKIQTIDSLCHSIAREQPLLSLLGGNLQAVDDAVPLYESAVKAFLGELESGGAASGDLAQLLLHYDNDVAKLGRLLVDMLAVREQWLGHVVGYSGGDTGSDSSDDSRDNDEPIDLEQTLARWIEHALGEARELLAGYASDIARVGDFAAGVLHDNPDYEPHSAIRHLRGMTALPPAGVAQHAQWLGVVELLLTGGFTPRKTATKKQGFLPKQDPDKARAQRSAIEKQQLMAICSDLATEPETLRALKTVASLPVGGYRPSQRRLLEPLARCLVQLCGHLHLVFGQTGQCDHSEVASAALRALGYGHTAGLWANDNAALRCAAESVQDNAAAYAWNRKLQHILVDEFQDTSISQFYLLHALTAEWPQHNISHPQDPHSLFIVGDGMQSIYSFRQARVELFLRCRRDGLGELALVPLELKQNFRSSEAIVEWVNCQFGDAFPRREDLARGAVCYAPSAALASTESSNEASGPAVAAYACIDDSDGELEAASIVDEINTCLQRDATGTIAILVRARSHLATIIPALEAAGIPWQGNEIDSLDRRETVIDCMTLARALLNPVDELAWFALLRAPWCGLQLASLQALKDFNQPGAGSPRISELVLKIGSSVNCEGVLDKPEFALLASALGPAETGRLALFSRHLWLAWSQRARANIRDWLEHCWWAIGGDVSSQSAAEGNDIASARAFFATLERFEQECQAGSAGFSLQELSRRVSRLYAEPPDYAKSSGAGVVQVMTIHKSKGLEFDTVILPGLARGGRAADKPLLISSERVFADGSSGLLLYPRPPAGLLRRDQRQADADIYEFLRSEAALVQQFELTRLLYVAATRARTRLVLLANLQLSDTANDAANDGAIEAAPEQRFKAPMRGSMLAKLWPRIAVELSVVDNIPASQSAAAGSGSIEPAEALRPIDNVTVNQQGAGESYALLKRFNDAQMADIHHPASARFGSTGTPQGSTAALPGDPVEIGGSNNLPERVLGTCVHEIFHLIAVEGLAAWLQRDTKMLRAHWLLRLQQLGLQPGLQSGALEKIERAVHNVLHGKTGRWLFDDKHKLRASEWSILYWDQQARSTASGSPWSCSIVDSTFIDADNCRWIIDYKVIEPGRGVAVEAFFETEAERYRSQLAHYRCLLASLDSAATKPVGQLRCALYFPLLDHLLEVETDSVAV